MLLKGLMTLTLVLISHIMGASQPTEILQDISQQHVLQYWDSLSPTEQQKLVSQIENISPSLFFELRTLIQEQENEQAETLNPFLEFAKSGSKEDFIKGNQLIAEGKVGCLIVAGGQGTRLRITGPKGVFPVTLIKHKTLFQIFAEKVLAAGRQVNRKLPLAIMTSTLNHEETVKYFQTHDYFGLDANQVTFFSQDNLPLLDRKGDLFLETKAKIAVGPDGNAVSLKHFVDKGIWANWKEQGIEYLNYVHIDNPLADPYDAELTGFHSNEDSDLVIKCIERIDPLEKLGVILRKEGKVHVIEYSEITPEERDGRREDGTLKHICGNISVFSFKMDFVHTIATCYYHQLPYHKTWKAVPYLSAEGKEQIADQPMAWKFEKFIFDVLPYAQSVRALLYPRAICFAPLKNAEGNDSLASVQAALLKFDIQTFSKITGSHPGSKIFELDTQFYYPTEEILNKWKGVPLPDTPYVEP